MKEGKERGNKKIVTSPKPDVIPQPQKRKYIIPTKRTDGISGKSGYGGHHDWAGCGELKHNSGAIKPIIDLVELRNTWMGEEWLKALEHDVSGKTIEDVNQKSKELTERVSGKLDKIKEKYKELDNIIDRISYFTDKKPGYKKLSHCIERTKIEDFGRCFYSYNFLTNQWLEDIDDFSGLSSYTHNEFKEIVIEQLAEEFKIALNSIIFGDPAGRPYVEEK